jgi:Flp pilus assembly protein TadD
MTFQYLRPVIEAGFVFALFTPLAAAKTPEQIFVQVSPSVVVVDIFDAKEKPIGLGSGAVIGVGQVITNCHVAQMGNSLQVRQSGKTFKAMLQYADPDRDLCQLSVPDLKAPPVILGSAKKLRVGQRVYAIGAPEGLELTLSEGLISSLRLYEGSQYIQTSAAISHGSSGGGLFDDQGRLVGITTFQFVEGQNLNFALPVDWIGELPKRAQAASKAAKKGGLDWINRAAAFEQKKDWHGVLNLSQQWVKSEPGDAYAWAILGEAYSKLKHYDQAIQACREALRIQPEYADAWIDLGLAYDGLKQFEQAIQALQEALRIQPENAAAWNNLGFVYLHLEQYDQAIQALKEALRIQPEYASAWNNLGIAYYLQGRHDKVREVYQTLRKLDPEMADKYFNTLILP